jgi:hypothetical protein
VLGSASSGTEIREEITERSNPSFPSYYPCNKKDSKDSSLCSPHLTNVRLTDFQTSLELSLYLSLFSSVHTTLNREIK